MQFWKSMLYQVPLNASRFPAYCSPTSTFEAVSGSSRSRLRSGTSSSRLLIALRVSA
ncbi:MAG: hypothetical protein OXH75_11000 [Acidobacteria bacterium]|nr:hypothetical protein [Acidobacteriota bacterium]